MKYTFVYGGIAGMIIGGLTLIVFFSGLYLHIQSPVLGYLVMLAGLTMIFVGVKRYRDVECGGVIRFGPALALALGIGLLASLLYVAAFEIFAATSAGWELVAQIETMLPGYSTNGLYRMWITLTEIAPPMLIVALLSAALLRNPRLLPARAA